MLEIPEPPDPGWHTERHVFMKEWELGKILRLPSGLIVSLDGSSAQSRRPTAHSEDGQSGHLYVMPGLRPRWVGRQEYPTGRVQKMLYTDKDPDKDFALLVTTEGKTLLRIKRRSEREFRSPTGSLAEMKEVPNRDPFWKLAEPEEAIELEPGLVEQVEPKWYW
jgi:hypothetical protein